MLAILTAEGAAIVFLGLLVVGLLRSHAEILRSLHDLRGDDDPAAGAGARPVHPTTGTHEEATDIVGESLEGEAATVGVVGAAHDTLLAFLSAGCLTCQPFWSALSTSVTAPTGARVVAVVQDGDNVAKLTALAGADLLVIRSDAAWSAYQVPGSPHFVYVDGPSGRIKGEGTAASWDRVIDMIVHAGGGMSLPGSEADRDNGPHIDRELLAAGIGPGHPSLHPDVSAPVDSRSPAP